MPRSPHLVGLAVGALLLTACGDGSSDTAPDEPAQTPAASASPSGAATASPTADTVPEVGAEVAEGLRVPWGITFLDDGSALVTERDTLKILHVTRRGGDWRTREVTTITPSPAVGPSVEGGLLGIATAPGAEGETAVFVYVTTAEDNRVLRGTFDGTDLGPLTPVLTDIPRADYHDGGRIAFGPDGHLYVSTGDARLPEQAQDPASLAGKILRMDRRGRPVADNPDPSSVVYSRGHRNVQGLAWDDDGQLWASEFGEQTWDELNRIEAGGNYGWPTLEGRASDNPDAGSGDGDFIDPVAVWSTDEASPSGLAWADGSLWLGALRGERLWEVRVDADGKARSTPHFVGEYGRLRTVVATPDGDLWLTTSNHDGRGQPAAKDDRILSVTP